jgi:Ribbon-helix-helix protein, copG family
MGRPTIDKLCLSIRPRARTAQVPPELLERAHERARLEDRSVAAVVRRALSQYLKQDPNVHADQQAVQTR